MKKDTILETYDKWSAGVQNNIIEVKKIFRQNSRKDIMQSKRQNPENVYERTVIIERAKLVKEHIKDKMERNQKQENH